MPSFQNQIPILETKRLRLRPFDLADANSTSELLQDLYIHQCTLNIPYPYQVSMAYEWIASHLIKYYQGIDLTLAIENSSNKKLMGAIGLNINLNHSSAEIGFWIGKEFRKNGYCTEALTKLTSYAFNKMKLNRLYATYFSWNIASEKVFLKCGFEKEGVFYQAVKKNGEFQDLGQVSLLLNNYKGIPDDS